MTTGEVLAPGAFWRLFAWLSPSFPTGAYSYSHGLERAVEAGLVVDRASLTRWIAAVLAQGAGRSDAVLLCAVHQAVTDDDEVLFDRAVELADALRGSAELGLESRAQGAAFLAAVRAAWPAPGLERWAQRIAQAGRAPAHAVAVAVAAGVGAVPRDFTVQGYLHAVAANLVSAGLRLVPLGQTDGQRALAALEPAAASVGRWALASTLADAGGAAPMVDWAAMTHETQYTRLFRS